MVREAERRDTVDPPHPPGTEPDPDLAGHPIGDTQCWAIIYSTRLTPPKADAGDDEETTFYLLQTVPRDHTPGPETNAEPGANKDNIAPPFEDIGPKAGTFYVAPASKAEESTGAYSVTLTADRIGELYRLGTLSDGTLEPPTRMKPGDNPAIVGWQKVLAKHGDSALTVARLLQSAFLPARDGRLMQPRHRPFDRRRTALPADPAEAARLLADASRDRGQLTAVDAAGAAVEERRSAFIATACETAVRIAESGGSLDAAWPTVGPGLDARDFGLTFVIGEEALGKLMQPGAVSDPPLLRMTIKSMRRTLAPCACTTRSSGISIARRRGSLMQARCRAAPQWC